AGGVPGRPPGRTSGPGGLRPGRARRGPPGAPGAARARQKTSAGDRRAAGAAEGDLHPAAFRGDASGGDRRRARLRPGDRQILAAPGRRGPARPPGAPRSGASQTRGGGVMSPLRPPRACRAARERLALRYYAALDGAEEETLERHLGSCPACAREWDLVKRALDALDARAIVPLEATVDWGEFARSTAARARAAA